MRKYFNYLALLLLVGMVSCADDKLNGGGQSDDPVDFSIVTVIPSGGIITYASHKGGATNVDPQMYDLRYTMEIWTGSGTNARLVLRDTQFVDEDFETESVTFSGRLAAMTYEVLLWADFVPQGNTTDDLYYDTSTDLKSIAMKAVPYELSQDARDAYYKKTTLRLDGERIPVSNITLQRPFGKFRLIATDSSDGINQEPTTVNLTYQGVTALPAQFNVSTGKADATTTIDASAVLGTTVYTEDAVVGGQVYNDVYVLASDYIFASDALPSVDFNIDIYDNTSRKLVTRELSNIPIQENKLTTIIGNFFTNEFDIQVIVDDPFNEEIIQTYFDPANLSGWVKDRYDVYSWTKAIIGGQSAFCLHVHPSGAMPGRPNGQQTNFYNTQGRKHAITNPAGSTKWELEAEFYVDNDMMGATYKPFLMGLWVVDAAVGYPNITLSNVEPNFGYTLGSMDTSWKVWTDVSPSTGLLESPSVSGSVIVGWNKVKMVSDGTGVKYYVNGFLIDQFTGSIAIEAVILQTYHFYKIEANPTYAIPASTYVGYQNKVYFSNLRCNVL